MNSMGGGRRSFNMRAVSVPADAYCTALVPEQCYRGGKVHFLSLSPLYSSVNVLYV
eukprot:COSAG02_NODE_1302_length_13358_cov_12.308243_9_plen_56_part_00